MTDKGSTTVDIREYIDSRISALEKTMSMQRESDRIAVAKSEASVEKRLEHMNEFRSALADASRDLMPRKEFEAVIREVNEKIISNMNRLNSRELMPRVESEARHTDTQKRVEELVMRVNARDERGRGRGDMWGWAIAGIALLVSIITVVLTRAH